MPPCDLYQPVDLAAMPDLNSRLRWGVGERLRGIGITVAVLAAIHAHAAHALPERTPYLDNHVALVDRDLALDLGHQALRLARHHVDAEEVLGLDGAGIAVTESRFQPFPGARPLVALLLFAGPDGVLGGALGLAQLHRPLIGAADAAVGIDLQRCSGGR